MRILYVTTSFPVFSETFLQREVRALLKAGAELTILSLHKGESSFEGYPVERFSKIKLLKLFYLLPWYAIRHVDRLMGMTRALVVSRPASPLNLFENLLGLGAAIVLEDWIRGRGPNHIHSVWASAPAAFAMLAAEIEGVRFSTGAHAYDVFEYGGDWILREKLRRAAFVHTSTQVAERRIAHYCDAAKIKLIRRGLSRLPQYTGIRKERVPLQIVCVARLVEKKGFPYQLKIYRALKDAGVSFQARIIGDGPLEAMIEENIKALGLGESVSLTGRLSEEAVIEILEGADLLFHTGIVAASGDRDGLPNVIPEAMACGAIVIGSPVSGVVEAIKDGDTGFLCRVVEPEKWVEQCLMVRDEPEKAAAISRRARDWVEREFVADVNSGRLLGLIRETAGC